MKRIVLICLYSAIIFSSYFANAQNKKTKIESVKLQENFYKFFQIDANMLVFTGPGGVLMVDTGFEKTELSFSKSCLHIFTIKNLRICRKTI